MEGSSYEVESIEKLFPWRVGEASGTSEGTTAIGDPIFTLSNNLKKNEIWLEWQEVEIKKYKSFIESMVLLMVVMVQPHLFYQTLKIKLFGAQRGGLGLYRSWFA